MQEVSLLGLSSQSLGSCYWQTLRVFGVGRRTVGRGPLAAAALPACPWQWPEVSPPPPMVRRRPIWSLDDVTATKTPDNVASHPLLSISGRFPHPSNYYRLTNSIYGLGPVPQTERPSMPTYGVQRFRHSAIIFAPSRLFALFEYKMASKTTSSSGFDLKFRLLAPVFILESRPVAVHR